MSQASSPAPGQIIVDLAFGFILSGALATAAKLKIADQLEAGPKSVAELAKASRVDEQSLNRVLRMLAMFQVFKEDGGKYHLTPAADLLRTSLPHTLHHAALMVTQDIFWKPVGELDDVVRSGENGMIPHFGAPFFDYLEQNKEAGAIFHRGMSSLSDLENAPIAQAYDWSGRVDTIVDVAGGHGGLLIEALKCAPNAKGVLYDVAHVLKDARVNEEAGRWTCVEGDFFKNVPAGGDVYMLKRIIHDWKDDDCVTILSNIRKVMNPGARILVCDCVIPAGNTPHGGKVLDVLMMSALPGFERTEAEFAALFAKAGLKLSRVIHAPALLSITEAVAA